MKQITSPKSQVTDPKIDHDTAADYQQSEMRDESVTKQVGAAVTEGWMEGGSFLGSILSGTLIGLGLDYWLGTSPWLVVIGVLVGSYSGFARTWQSVKNQPNPPAVTLQMPPVDEVGS